MRLQQGSSDGFASFIVTHFISSVVVALVFTGSRCFWSQAMTWLRRVAITIAIVSLAAACASAPVREVVFQPGADPETGDDRSLVMIREGSAQLRWQCGPDGLELFFRWGRYVEHGNSVSVGFEFIPELRQPWPRGGAVWLSGDRRGGFLDRSAIPAFTRAALSSEKVRLRVVEPSSYLRAGDNVSTRELSLTGLSTELVKLPCYKAEDPASWKRGL